MPHHAVMPPFPLLALFFIFTVAFHVFEVIAQLSHTCLKAFPREFPPVKCFAQLTRALIGQSLQAHSVKDKTGTDITIKHGGFAE